MAAEYITEDEYRAEVDDRSLEITHSFLKKPKRNNFLNRWLMKFGDAKFATNASLFGYFSPLVLSFLAAVVLQNVIFVALGIGMIFVGLFLGILLRDIFKPFLQREKINSKIFFFNLPKINKLSNKKQAVQEYVDSLSFDERKELFNKISMLSKLEDKEKEFKDIGSLLDNDSVFHQDISEKQKVLNKKKAHIRKYFDEFEEKVVINSVDDAFLSTMASFAELVGEDDDSNKIAEEVVLKTEKERLVR